MPQMLEKFNWKFSNVNKFAFQIFTLKIKSEHISYTYINHHYTFPKSFKYEIIKN